MIRQSRRVALGILVLSLASSPSHADVSTPAAKALVDQGLAAMQSGKNDDALARFKSALGATKDPAEQDEIQTLTARALAASGKVDESRALLKTALKRPSSILAAELGRNMLYNQPVAVEDAISFLSDYCKKNAAKDPEPWLVLAKAYIVHDQAGDAAKVYQKIIKEVKREEVRAWTGLADAYILDGGRFKEANDALHEAQRVFPDHPDVLFALGRVAERDTRSPGNIHIAANYYREAANVAKVKGRYRAAAMFAFMEGGDTPSAIAEHRSLKATSPQDSYALWFDGLNEEVAFHIPQAIDLYEHAVSANYENAYAHYVLARVYLGQGNKALRLSGAEPPESFRVAPFRDVRKGMMHVAIVKYLDPTFPGLTPLLGIYAAIQQRQEQEQTISPEQKEALQSFISFTQKMNRYR